MTRTKVKVSYAITIIMVLALLTGSYFGVKNLFGANKLSASIKTYEGGEEDIEIEDEKLQKVDKAAEYILSGNNGSGHSMVCIGHGNVNKELIKKAKRNKWISWDNKEHCHPLINSADFYEDYVVVDDNQPIYQVRPFQQLSLYPDMRVENIAVPLYKRMFLDASDAAAIVRSILHHEQFGIDVWADEFLEHREDVVIRLFMASSRSLKYFRSETLSNFYAEKHMPLFLCHALYGYVNFIEKKIMMI